MDIVNLMDLSFLTSEEQAIIQDMLKRDTNLKKREEERIRKMKRDSLDQRCLKLQTGEWFEDLKAKRFLDYSSATDLLKCVLQRNAQTGLVPSRKMSCFSKIRSLKTLQMIADKKLELKKGCQHVVGNNIAVKDESATSPSPEEELSVTQILKDLELILDLEIQNTNSSAEIADINGFSPENVMVDKNLPADYSSHQVWHYPAPTNLDTTKMIDTLTLVTNPSSESETSTSGAHSGLLSLEVLQANLSPVINTNYGSGKGLQANKYAFLNEDGIQYANSCHMQMSSVTDHVSQFVSSGHLSKPFCSSPCMSPQFLFPENCFTHNHIEMSCDDNCILEPNHPSKQSELSFETSLDTESTIEQSTMIAVNSPSLAEGHVPSNNASLQDNLL